jgi:hypothetical protein
MFCFLVAVIFEYIYGAQYASERAIRDAQRAKHVSEGAKQAAKMVTNWAKTARGNAEKTAQLAKSSAQISKHAAEIDKHAAELFKHAGEMAKHSVEITKQSELSVKHCEESAKSAEECAQYVDNKSPTNSSKSAQLAHACMIRAVESASHAAMTYKRALQSKSLAKGKADVQYIMLYTQDIVNIAKRISDEAEQVSTILTEFNSIAVTNLDAAHINLTFTSALYNTLKTDPNVNVKEITLKLDNWTKQIVNYIRQMKQYLKCIKTRLSTDRKHILSTWPYFASVKAHINAMSNLPEDSIIMKAVVLNYIAVTTNHLKSMMSEIEVINFEISPAEESIVALERHLMQHVPPIAAAG